MKGGMRMLYRPEAVARHYHDITFASFRRRQEKAGEAAAIFYRKHPELADFLAVPQALQMREGRTVGAAAAAALGGAGGAAGAARRAPGGRPGPPRGLPARSETRPRVGSLNHFRMTG